MTDLCSATVQDLLTHLYRLEPGAVVILPGDPPDIRCMMCPVGVLEVVRAALANLEASAMPPVKITGGIDWDKVLP